MARETVYIVQAYKAGRRKAERLAPLREGVVAFAASADVELGDYDENPQILFKAGRLPFPFDQA